MASGGTALKKPNLANLFIILSCAVALQFGGYDWKQFIIMQAHAACGDSPGAGVNWEGCRKRNLVLSGTDLSNAQLKDTNFTSTDMRQSKFDGANFRKAVLLRVAFDESSAKGAIFEKAIIYRVSFKNSDLSQSMFQKSEMLRVNFNGANLTGTNFSKSEAGRSQFENATMGNNDFSFSNLARADFRKAKIKGPLKLEGAFLFQTRIEGVDISKAIGLAQWQVDMACGDEETLLPEGLTRPDEWGCEGE